MKFAKLFFITASVAFFFSCSEDTDDVPSPSNSLIGSWALTEVEYEGTTTTTFDGQQTNATFTGTGYDMNFSIQFNENPNDYEADGTYSIRLETTIQGHSQPLTSEWENPGFIGTGSWEKNGDQLIVTSNNGDIQEATISELNANTLDIIWEFSQTTTESGATIVQDVNGTYTFQRN